jgi:catechol 2,3-dioxygenase-like lactoylglutathione lyase family enzyme
MLYTSEPEALRAFLRDKLGFAATDVGDGWLVFALPGAEMGCHPSESQSGQVIPSGTHQISFMCDDIEATVAELKARGVQFTGGIEDPGYGLATHFEAPGGLVLELYQPSYELGTG